ncbi:MAG TPA: hypothetical protein VMM36_09030, partial [Opitutaceae bacterium]|nr:hypothetical protein [Opitutaceae bacterium]
MKDSGELHGVGDLLKRAGRGFKGAGGALAGCCSVEHGHRRIARQGGSADRLGHRGRGLTQQNGRFLLTSMIKSRRTSHGLPGAFCVLMWLAGIDAVRGQDEETVVLQDFIVEGEMSGQPWRYGRLPGFEILSRCYDDKSSALAFSYYRARRQLEVLIPERFLGRFDVPTKLILYDSTLRLAAEHGSAAEVLPSMRIILDSGEKREPGDPTPFDRMRAPDPLLSIPVYSPPKVVEGPTTYSRQPVSFKDMRLSDVDEIVLFALAPAGSGHYYQRALRPSYLAKLIAARTPQLPGWFVAGFLDLYGRLEFSESTLMLDPFQWIDQEQTKSARRNPRVVTAGWRPLVELLGDDPDVVSQRSPEAMEAATAQLRLFIRWALDPKNSRRREAFWSLVDRNCKEPMSEELFESVFGESSSEVSGSMARYLPTAFRDPVVWHAPHVEEPRIEFVDATRADSARIRGDWERLQADYVRTSAPAFTAKYREKAQITLQRAYERGERGADFLAVLGLNELDGGDTSKARGYLEQATTGGVVQPKAYLE